MAMSDIFISYARSTEAEAERITQALRTLGYDVWRDDDIPAHRRFGQVLEERLAAAKAVLVLWSSDATNSDWVLSEASRAREMAKLVQLTLDRSALPMPFDQIQCVDLSGWTGQDNAASWRKVVSSLAELVGAPTRRPARPVESEPGRAGESSIAVMPLANLSGDADQDYFADGMVVEITNALSRFKSLFVIASGSTLSLKGAAVSPVAAAKLLGVRYVLEGSVRRAASRVRISVQLIDGRDGAQKWSQQFEDTLEDIFALQDKVALAVAGAVGSVVGHAEVRRASERPTDNPTSHDLYLRALAKPIVTSAEELRASLDLLEQAIALDPNHGPALSRAAMAYRNRYQFGWSSDPDADRLRAIDLAQRALAMARDDADVLANAASVLSRAGGDPGASIELLDRAVGLNPGSAWAWFVSGRLRVNLGDAARGGDHIENSMRLDPLSPLRPSQLQNLGLARFALGRFDEALALVQQASQLRPQAWDAQFLMAACLGQLGQGAAAGEAFARGRDLNPKVGIDDHAGQILRDGSQRRIYLDGVALAEGALSPDDRNRVQQTKAGDA